MKSPKKLPGDSQSDIAPKSPKSMKSNGKKEGASPSPSPMKSSKKTEGASPERGQDQQNEKGTESPHKKSSAQRAEKRLPKGKGKGKAKSKSKPKLLPKEKGKGKGKAKSKPSAKACASNSHPGRVFKGLLRPKSHDTVLTSVMKIQMTKLSSAELERLVANMKSASAESGFTVSSGCSGSNMSFIVLKSMCEIMQVPLPPKTCSCASKMGKQRQCLEHLAASEGQDTCIFSDVGDLKETHAECKRHLKKCPVHKVMLSDLGFLVQELLQDVQLFGPRFVKENYRSRCQAAHPHTNAGSSQT